MQIASVETSVGTAIWPAPATIATGTCLPCSRCQLMLSMVTVALSTRMPTASASPPSVITLIVSPIADSAAIEQRIDSGIDTAMISEERQLPRNNRIIRLASAAAITPSRITPDTAALTKMD